MTDALPMAELAHYQARLLEARGAHEKAVKLEAEICERILKNKEFFTADYQRILDPEAVYQLSDESQAEFYAIRKGAFRARHVVLPEGGVYIRPFLVAVTDAENELIDYVTPYLDPGMQNLIPYAKADLEFRNDLLDLFMKI